MLLQRNQPVYCFHKAISHHVCRRVLVCCVNQTIHAPQNRLKNIIQFCLFENVLSSRTRVYDDVTYSTRWVRSNCLHRFENGIITNLFIIIIIIPTIIFQKNHTTDERRAWGGHKKKLTSLMKAHFRHIFMQK